MENLECPKNFEKNYWKNILREIYNIENPVWKLLKSAVDHSFEYIENNIFFLFSGNQDSRV